MGSREWADTWAAVHDERHALSADLAQIDPARWSDASLCPGWDIHDVVAHLIDSAKTTRLGFARRMLAARFDFDRDNEAGLSRERRSTPAETLAAFRLISTDTPATAHSSTRRAPGSAHASDGTEPAVRAPALILLLSVSGRPVDEAELEGPGAQAFAERLEACR